MKFNTTFNVLARCNKYDKDNKDSKPEKVDLTLKINDVSASYFLFKFTPYAFALKDYKVIIKADNISEPIITLFKDNYIYIVSNTQEVFSEIALGYYNLRTMNKINSLLSIDFETMNEVESDDTVLDEFDIDKN